MKVESGQPTEILIYNEYKYALREIQEEYMPALTPYVKNPAFKRRGRKSKIVKMFNCYSLHYARLMDLVKLQEMRQGLCRNKDGTLTETGQREIMCFLYRYWSCCFTKDKEKALKDTLEFNKGFLLPLDENTVRTQTRQAEKADKIKAVKKLKDKGLMQKGIAKELKVTQQYVSKILKELQ
ncbi:hypothetical protein [Clostridium botulinum]|uniref:hypothetical protein n=1 Tax=Clostridium botulinum TaxID=1491 RepID=UPI001E30B0B6|nr:hypothetical protein [Clostridium botulinum]